MTKVIYSLTLGFAVLATGFCGAAMAQSTHNAQRNAYAEPTSYWQWQPYPKRLGSEMSQLSASRSSAGQSLQRNIIASTALSADELERVQNEN